MKMSSTNDPEVVENRIPSSGLAPMIFDIAHEIPWEGPLQLT